MSFLFFFSSFATFSLHDYLLPQSITTVELIWQLPLVLLQGLLAWFLSRYFPSKTVEKTVGIPCWFRENIPYFLLFIFLGVSTGLARLSGYPLGLLHIGWVLTGLWLAVALLAAYSQDRMAMRVLAISAYLVITLHLLGLLEGTMVFLDNIRLDVGNIHITAYSVLIGIFALAVALWLGLWTSRFLEARIQSLEKVSPSVKVLINKIIRIVLLVVAVLVAVDSMGLDLTVLTVMGGGIGLGLGFGLQKVISNLVSGFILLSDKSIKPGDVIEIGGTYGWINNLKARYASIITRDGTEHLIPNEDLITQRVVNWSYSNKLVRLRMPIGIAYDSNIHLAIKLVVKAAQSTPRVLKDPAPRCLLKGFGDNSLDLEARVWIEDPDNGVASVKSAVLLKIWDAFQEADIEIPYPQRDLHLKSPTPFQINLTRSPSPDSKATQPLKEE